MRKTKIIQRGDEVKRRREIVKYGHGGGQEGENEASHDGSKE